MKSESDFVQQNIELSAEFSRYLFEHPELETVIPKEAQIILLPDFDPDLRTYNEALGHELEAEGEKVFYVRIGQMKPKTFSRLEAVEVG